MRLFVIYNRQSVNYYKSLDQMKTKLLLSLITVLLSISIVSAHSGDTIVIPYGSASTIDGEISTGEWDDASTLQVVAISGTVYFKHNNTHLFIAFSDPIGYYSSTGIYLDKNHDGGSTPQTDDVWIHGSANAFEFTGDGSTWNMVAPTDWNYVSNTANEYSISLSKLGIAPGNYVIMGILFSFLDWSTTHNEITWPSGGFPNCSNPDSWATLIIPGNTGIDEKSNSNIHITPNPASSNIFIESDEKIQKIIFIDNSGKTVSIQEFPGKTVALPNTPDGLYFLKIYTENGVIVKKILKKS